MLHRANLENDSSITLNINGIFDAFPRKLYLKSKELAEYASKQFRDIYKEFCYISK